jgi:cation diffusion facilitator family transporter
VCRDKASLSEFGFDPAVHPRLKVAAISISANAILLSVELFVAWITGSLSVLADAFHSGVDLTGSTVALSGIWMALRAIDRRYPYGYARYENASALIQFVLIAIIGVTVIYEAVRRYFFGFEVRVSAAALAVIIATVAFDLLLFRYIARRGRTLQSSALEADSYHFGTDAVGKIGVMVGMGAAFLGFPIMDLVGAVAIAIGFLVAAFQMGRKNLRVLTDASPPDDLLDALQRTALGVAGVAEVHSLRGRVSGKSVLVDLVVHVSPESSLEAAHKVAHEVEEAIRRELPSVADIVVHAEPIHHDRRLDKAHSP